MLQDEQFLEELRGDADYAQFANGLRSRQSGLSARLAPFIRWYQLVEGRFKLWHGMQRNPSEVLRKVRFARARVCDDGASVFKCFAFEARRGRRRARLRQQ
jgi:hypothetical protein